MNGKVVLSLLAPIAILALSPAMAQAGGGQGAGTLVGFFACHGINGGDQGQVVDLTGDELGVDRQGIRVGSGIAACTPVQLFDAATGNEISAGAGSYLKCYSTAGARKPADPPQGPPARYNAADAFDPADTVQVTGDLVLCAPAEFTLIP